ncbi:MAG: glycosyltransferase family 4 protein [Hyphomicrobiales bacterium]|nr:glycosyltransferase family 4 protein [Hyphomicrobiales bacterium]
MSASHFYASGSSLSGRTILQIVPRLDGGGAERTTLEIAQALAESGARALVASQGGAMVGELQALGGEFTAFPAASKNPFTMARNVRKLAALIRRNGVDLVHARSRAPAWTALAAARRAGVPFVTTYHGAYSDNAPMKRQYNSVMAMGDAVIANSHFTAQLVAERHPDAQGRIVAIPRGVDPRVFAPEATAPERVRFLREQWGVAPDQRIVLLPARMTRRKGHLVLVAAAKMLREAGRGDLVFVLIGAGARGGYEREIDRAAAAAGLAQSVKRAGACDDMPAAYAAAACVAAPSIEPETFGRVAVEAQAMGRPTVVSDLGASAETVIAPPDCAASQRTGWRVEPNDAAALARAIAEALDLGAAAQDGLALRARNHVRAHFSLERMQQATLDLYGHLLGL